LLYACYGICMHACLPRLYMSILIHAILIIADPSFSQVDRSSYFNTTFYIYIYKTPFYLVLIPVELHRRRPEAFTCLWYNIMLVWANIDVGVFWIFFLFFSIFLIKENIFLIFIFLFSTNRVYIYIVLISFHLVNFEGHLSVNLCLRPVYRFMDKKLGSKFSYL